MSKLETALAEMVRIDSTNPGLAGGPGEGAFAADLAARMERLGMEVDLWDVLPGRPNVVGRLRGRGGGCSLMLLGHLDVVGPWGPNAFEPRVRDGHMYGRGTADMKCGFAAALTAVESLVESGERLAGDLLVAGVIDEEWESAGAAALTQRWRADASVLVECTGLDVVGEHGGFAWFEVESRGVEAAGVDPEHGVDGIALLAPVLAGIAALDTRLASRPPAAYGRGSIHASTINGGDQLPVYPARCVLGVERCLVAGETVAQAQAEMASILAAARAADVRFDGELRTIVAREPLAQSADEPVVAAVVAAAAGQLGRAPIVRGDIAWGDSG
ncbi:MAG TPA: M20/M25/M40 family metallo-hydrolase, partial [Thermoleophilia bacterium]|nr:M20/M25/M40 family metallo-hydrolase [Thermoleophilia bacterium]